MPFLSDTEEALALHIYFSGLPVDRAHSVDIIGLQSIVLHANGSDKFYHLIYAVSCLFYNIYTLELYIGILLWAYFMGVFTIY